MKEHISEIHEEGKEPFKCDICNQSFSQKGNLSKHTASVHDSNKLLKGSSTKHITSVHNAKKSFKCDICDPSFYKKKHIVKVHESKKPFTCNLLM